MRRFLFLLAIVALSLPAAAFAKGPSEARIDGPGIGKAIVISGPEEEGSALMSFAEAAGFFPAVFGQEPNPLAPSRPKGPLGPRFKIDYTVPGPDGATWHISQDLYPYAKPFATTYMPSDQELFEGMRTRGGWYESPDLKQRLIEAGLPATPPSGVDSKSSSFFSGGKLGAVGGVLALLIAVGSVLFVRRRERPGHAA